MKQIVRYRFMNIPNKMIGEIRISVDERSAEYSANFEGGKSTNISLFPIINLQLLQQQDSTDQSTFGKISWDPNSSLGLTKFTFPIFLDELKAINRGLRKPDLYTYHGTRLEINAKEAEKIRRVFMISNTTVELSPVVLDTADNKLEGIKIKFNNEKASVLLTVNELTALLYNLSTVNIDMLSFTLYLNYITKGENYHSPRPRTLVDIVPKASTPYVVSSMQMGSDGEYKKTDDSQSRRAESEHPDV